MARRPVISEITPVKLEPAPTSAHIRQASDP
jgi:hypothetical protein